MIELTFRKELVLVMTSELKECDICHYWCILNKECKFKLYVCNRCLDLLMMSMPLSDIAILNIKGSNY